VTCGKDTLTRVRHCSTGNADDCPGISIEKVPCDIKECPGECVFCRGLSVYYGNVLYCFKKERAMDSLC